MPAGGSRAAGTPDGGSPVLRLQDPAGGFNELGLDAGSRLGFRLAAAGKFCLGHHKVHGPADRDHVLCPDRAPAVKGSQCERCFVVDDSRLIHDFHRGGRVPPGLRAYLMQPHWLYVATFANGASKVGTASHLRKWNRLAEQGAVVARYVARADDGRVVRILEDMVTRDAGLPQQVRSAAKAAALAAPAPAVELDALNCRLAGDVRGCWRAPASKASWLWTSGGCARGSRIGSAAGFPARLPARANRRYPRLPHRLAERQHRPGPAGRRGPRVRGEPWPAEGADRRARDHGSDVPAVQESLF